jgi:hypothetical protein
MRYGVHTTGPRHDLKTTPLWTFRSIIIIHLDFELLGRQGGKDRSKLSLAWMIVIVGQQGLRAENVSCLERCASQDF